MRNPRTPVRERFLYLMYQVATCGLTPELSRPVAGRRTRASVAHSTWPTPRRGVGLNELLGAKEPGEDEALADLPKAEAGRPERAPRTFPGRLRSDSIWSRLTERKRMKVTEADERTACYG
jgi:hypothetical protein